MGDEVEALPPGLEDRISWDDLDKRKYYVIGPSVFIFVRAAVYPSNLVKTRLQVQSRTRPLYNGTFDAFRKIVRQEGFLGLYKGFGASLLNIFIGNLYISVYEFTHKLAMENVTDTPSTANFISGATASVVNQTVIVPLDIVSQRMMIDGQGGPDMQSKTRHRTQGLMSIAKDIYRTQGVRGFYKGYVPSILTYAPSSALWWGSYGVVWPHYYRLLNFDIDPMWRQMIAQAFGGGTAGVVTAIITNPMDVIRTRTQIHTQFGAVDTFKYLIKREGIPGLWTGAVARVMAMGPSGVLVITAYELVKRLSRKTHDAVHV
ncbi:Mitochondrial Carrier (MC) Family [Thraustotheca clavata]|uniref:Mitochondrial Carrier (MC) Family n=1 Tax=Thraustotheca clavata TaxID=74557 RepID=A0A1V9ZQ95_9STRA|nr:Mitochondrial Carrier (MC) Family [Thraustotheca clavata]